MKEKYYLKRANIFGVGGVLFLNGGFIFSLLCRSSAFEEKDYYLMWSIPLFFIGALGFFISCNYLQKYKRNK